MKEIKMDANGLEIVIRGDSRTFFGQDLITTAIVALISEADTHAWKEKEGNARAAEQFYSAIFSAVARHYVVDTTLQEDTLVSDVVYQMVDLLVERKRLQQIINADTGQLGEA